MQGWIKLHRQLQSHWLYTEKRAFSQLEAWIDIIMTVNHKECKISIKGKPYEVKRGESLNSLDTWARRWNWHKSKVRRFLVLLQNDNMIVFKSETKSTRITVCNYDNYQETRNENELEMNRFRNGSETLSTPNKNDKKENNENNSYITAEAKFHFNQNSLSGNYIKRMMETHSQTESVVLSELEKWIVKNEDEVFRDLKHLKNSFNIWMMNYKPDKKNTPKPASSKIDWDELKREMS